MENRKQATDPRIIRTRQLIRDAFVELLQEMEIEKITVNRIAERATINRVTFYLHYRDIPDMMDKMADEMTDKLSQLLNGAADIGYIHQHEGEWPLLEKLLEHIAENSKFYKVVLGSRRTPIFTERLLRLLTENITDRIERLGGDKLTKAGIQKDIAIWYTSSALIGTIVSWLRKDMPYSPRYLAEQFKLIRTNGAFRTK
ncbi:TetR/AcrR family transcriptional regulator [Paenibacillus xylaniclasticus]|uniref:TetR/AcrR family transcriptional regulator n=1 Tax=Paenibacillus xylaniclasticus TaxID=588083 RepID=UPI000FD99C24|nr:MULTISPECIES: TetR/AcrR family transcriptional regulator C-terminal domain-containing protein [Paenibacillus]GFN32180.1 TetR family transcriptional regulator [Paenibacillus curdlanolyticus]